MGADLITAAMIVRDEAAHLPACLESIRDVVDEIMIVDTGSSDETVSIAESFGARVVVHPWTGNFAEARNVGLDLATGRWILYIDADERLRPIDPKQARVRLEAAPEVALRVRLRLFKDATPAWEYRLWRSDPRIRFVGKMHENITTAIAAVAEADRRLIGESELFLEHVGYEGDQTRKHMRNLPLLQAQLADNPIDPFSWHHLAVVLDGLGRAEQSEAALEQAMEVARKTTGRAAVLPFMRLIARRRELGQDTTDVLDEAMARHPDTFGLVWLKVLAEIKAGRYERALHMLDLFDVDPEMPVEDTIAYPTEMFGARTAEARGICLFKLGRYHRAAAAFAQAEKLEPDEPAHGLKRTLAEHRAARAGSSTEEPTSRSNGFRWPARLLLRGHTIDIGGIPVRMRATDAMRAAAVRALLGPLRPSDRDPVADVTFGAHRPLLPERDPDALAGPFRLWYDDGDLSIAYGSSVAASVRSGSATIGGRPENLVLAFRHVAPLMLGSLLAPHDRFIVHGGAIQRDEQAVVILGGSGMGKSTLVHGALRDGWSVLSDDLVVLSSSPAGPLVAGIPKPLVVPEEVVGDSLASVPFMADPRDRVQVPFEAWDGERRPIGAIVVVCHGDGPTAAIEPIERPELFGLLMASMLSREPRNVRRYFPLAASLCDLRAYRLSHATAPSARAHSAARVLAAHLDD